MNHARWLSKKLREVGKMALESGLPMFAVVILQTSGIDLGPLSKLADAIGCGLRTFGPYLAFLFVVIGVVLVVASSGKGVSYVAYALFGLAAVAAAPKIISSVGSMFNLGLSLSCQ